ncbi:hypothetical protein C0992_001004, partial [Termitomyces sp. T32_za158]
PLTPLIPHLMTSSRHSVLSSLSSVRSLNSSPFPPTSPTFPISSCWLVQTPSLPRTSCRKCAIILTKPDRFQRTRGLVARSPLDLTQIF